MTTLRNQLKQLRTKLAFGALRDAESGLNFRPIRLDNGESAKFFYRLDSNADVGVIKHIFRKQNYDLDSFPFSPALRAFTAAAGDRKLLVVDAGANIGASAVYFSALDPRIHVHAIEPEPNNFRILQMNVSGRRVVAEQAALAETRKTLWLEDPGQGDWAFRAGDSAHGAAVQAVDMASVLARYGDDYVPYVCKIDIEGGEEYLFSANTDWVSRFALIVIELHDGIRPGSHMSRNFLRAIAAGNFDVAWRGENFYCVNNDVAPPGGAHP